jgi:hypothetical protein
MPPSLPEPQATRGSDCVVLIGWLFLGFRGVCCLDRAGVTCLGVTNLVPYRHQFQLTMILHAVWLYHTFLLSYRYVQELLHQGGIDVSHETLREWCIKFRPLFAEDEPRRGSRWHLDKVCTAVDGVRHWLWRVVLP